jgi:DNA modification methylase
MLSGDMKIETWHGCYESSWNDLIVPDAFTHPAKFSHGLIARIFRHMLDEGMLAKGDTVVDPFGGVACGGIVAAGMGLRWIGCELEPKFVALGGQNIALHRRVWESCGDPLPVLVCGDSRKLRETLRGVLASSVVSSPPYAGDTGHDGGCARLDAREDARRESEGSARRASYGTSVGQLGSMKPGDVDSVVSSPPYNLPMSQDHNGACGGTRGTEPSEDGAFAKYGSTPGQLEGLPMGDVGAVVSSPPYAGNEKSDYRIKDETGLDRDERRGYRQGQGCFRGSETYGKTPGNLGAMDDGEVDAVISSPPYAETLKGDNSERETAKDSRAKRRTQGGSLGQSQRHQGYGGDGNLGNLPAGAVDAIATSPPYDEGLGHGGTKPLPILVEKKLYSALSNNGYGGSKGNISNSTGETFWSAARDIVAECHAILKPGGWSAWVVKDFIRNKHRVPFCDDWCRLLESCGFVVVKRVRAMLVKEHRHPDLFGGDDHVKRTERKSFFRRLYEKKYPDNSIDFEEVIFAQRQTSS